MLKAKQAQLEQEKEKIDTPVETTTPEPEAVPTTPKEERRGVGGRYYVEDPNAIQADEMVTRDFEYGGGSTARQETKEGPKEELARAKQEMRARRENTKRESSRDGSDVKLAYIKHVPVSVLEIAKTEFPLLSNQRDVITAYVVATSDGPIPDDLDDEVYAAVVAYRNEDAKTNPLYAMDVRLARLEKQGLETLAYIRELELALGYLIFDRMGFRKEAPSSPARINLVEPGVDDILRVLESQSKSRKAREDIRKGRPL